MVSKLNQTRWKIHYETARLNYILECFGDNLAAEEGYPNHVDGFEAIYLYLSRKHGWTISQCRLMPLDDIRLALSLELSGWRLPDDAKIDDNHSHDDISC